MIFGKRRAKEEKYKDIILLSVVLLGVFLVWANATKLDLVTRGQGRVVTLASNQMVQVSVSGAINAFHATAGGTITQGDVIAEVNPVEAKASLAEASQRLSSLSIVLARLEAELDDETWSGEVFLDGSEDEVMRSLVAAEEELSRARRADRDARRLALIQSQAQTERELEGVRAETFGNMATAAVLAEEREEVLPLVAAGAVAQTERYRLERDSTNLTTQANVLREREAALRYSVQEIAAQIAAVDAGYFNEVYTQRAETLQQINELSERLPALQKRVSETDVRAPISGTVNQVFFDSIGAFVKQGDTIAEIVPTGGDVRVKALILPEDIANVEPGQDARITLTAYNAAKYGSLDGKVIRVSADSSFSEEIDARAFSVDVSIASELTLLDGDAVEILPGMVAQVDIIRGQRSILEYFWNPVLRVRDRALRE
ncbi:HlyD family type I secretion periplasmic adaptor subunit [Celeribacter marinus]|uniref:Membrane fusion protein (MFP) family protein n=1 Tax=Celeribacter marinus TaxID=1397108 RepID=A0A0N7HIZ4_9RHOB|nr:HlyD family type I secretion periplasmic adaptor subunit [Celeribacter marinus]ALI56589.1 type I secretion system, membrane fusion protein LapC [Celeribacter marinus]SFK59680.1 membrane fusion protein, adhesin transport system [Celeribacter marinus]